MLRTKTLACVLGRFNPLHFSHIPLFEEALVSADLVAIILGSHNRPRTSRDPFICEEREEQIRGSFSASDNQRMLFIYAEDFPSDEDWAENIRAELAKQVVVTEKSYLMEFHKDERTSSAIQFLRQALKLESKLVPGDGFLSATAARRIIFLEERVPPWLTVGVKNWIKDRHYLFSDNFMRAKREQEYLDKHFERWKGTPYPVQFNAADAVCFSENKVLLLERNTPYGFGQLANPGGMMEQYETSLQSALRETREETCMFGLEKYLVNKNPVLFENPYRSLRGRVISHAFRFNLPPGFFATASETEEARKIIQMDLGQLDKHKSEFFEDHYHMIRRMLELH